MSSFRPAYFDCPSCKGQFRSFVVQSVGCNGQDSDLYTHFLGAFPLIYFVKVCPGCGFAGRTDEFAFHSEEEIMGSSAGDGSTSERTIRFLGDEDRGLTACMKYMALAERLVAEKAAPEVVGDAYLSASYCARLDNSDQIEVLRMKALSEFLHAVDLPRASRKTMYLCAELLRLSGKCDEASERLKVFLALPVEDEQTVDLRAFATILLKKSMRGNSRDIEFRWDETGTMKWAEWTHTGRESAWKKRQEKAKREMKSLFKDLPKIKAVTHGDLIDL
jgi:hypothetical protein